MAKRRASVPLLTAIEWFVPQKAANASSKASTIGPPMKQAVCKARRNTPVSSCSSSRWGVTRSRNGMLLGMLFTIGIRTFRCLFYITQNPSRIAGYDRVGWDIFCYDAPRAHNCVLADVDIGENRRARSD